ncbi:lytic transglycosylase domain-containing protein [Magnetococcus sp. PR-3]|uniref:lytic transglycosylase domain-containing protein n=1 Tax=Magnetococcus sp. PR-3 TaxID=3120355 RepID=UPI002FCE638E
MKRPINTTVGWLGVLAGLWVLPGSLWSAVPATAASVSGHVSTEQRATPAPRTIPTRKGTPAAKSVRKTFVTLDTINHFNSQKPLLPSSDAQKRSLTPETVVHVQRATPRPKIRRPWAKFSLEKRFKKRFSALLKPQLPADLLRNDFWEEDDFLASYVAWERLFHPDYRATVSRLQAFLKQWPDHPLAYRVRGLLDQRMISHKNHRVVADWYQNRTIKSGKTAQRVRYLEALVHEKRFDKAWPIWRRLYREGNALYKGLEKQLRTRFSPRLSQSDHEARAWVYIRKKRVKGLEKIIKAFDPGRADYFRALASAYYGRGSFKKHYQTLNAEDKMDGRLWEARIMGLWRHKRRTAAIALLMGVEGGYLSEKVRASLRYRFGKDLLYLREKISQAHLLLQANADESTGRLADSTWMAGWSALKLGKKEVALNNFRRLGLHAKDRNRASQGAYWTAKLLEQEGKPFNKWLRKATKHPDTFYGLLAIERLKGSLTADNIGGRKLTCNDVPFEDGLLKTARLRMAKLVRMDRAYYVGSEVKRIAKKLKLSPMQQICLAENYQDPHHVIRTASALRNSGGGKLWRGLYPEPGRWAPATGWTLHPAAVWGTVRQESLFNHRIKSSAGAMGMMQLMPATARGEARILKLPRATQLKLLRPEYNLSLGQSYLQRMLARHEGDMALALISYNAGPGRAKMWKGRRDKMDALTFIEEIPFAETRHYVKRVTHGQAIYLMRYQGQASLNALVQPRGPGLDALKPPANWQTPQTRLSEAELAFKVRSQAPRPKAALHSFYDPILEGETAETF